MDKFIVISIAKLIMNASERYWGDITLGKLGNLVSGTGFPIEYQGVAEGQYLFCKVSDMNLGGNEKYINYSVNTISDQIRAKIKAKIYPPGTVIFPKIGGAIATNKRRILGKEAAFDNNIMGMVPNAQVNSEWLYYCLQSIDFATYQLGTSVPSLRGDTLSQIRVPNVPLLEQEQIAQFLNWIAIQKGIVDWSIAPQLPNELDNHRRIVAHIEALAARIAEARGLRQQAVEEIEALMLEAPAEVFKSVAVSSNTIPIGQAFKFRYDLIHPTDGESGPLRFIGLQHVESHTGKRIGEDNLLAEELKGRKFRFSPGEIVYGYLRPYLNKVWIADCDGFCSVDQYVIQPRSNMVDTQYLAHYMRSKPFLKRAIELTHNLQLPRLRSGLLEGIPIPIPSISEQNRIVAYLEDLHRRVDALKRLQAETAAELDALLPAVLDRAFRGEL